MSDHIRRSSSPNTDQFLTIRRLARGSDKAFFGLSDSLRETGVSGVASDPQISAPQGGLFSTLTEIRANRATTGFAAGDSEVIHSPDIVSGQYLLTDLNRSVLPSEIHVDGSNRKLRAKTCLTFPVTRHGQVEHKVNIESGRQRFAGLNCCKSVHLCPTCSTAIRQCRAARCRMAIAECLRDEGQVPLVTLTTSHCKEDNLFDLVKGYKAARSAFHKTRPVVDLKKLVRCQSVVWVMEINFHELNGWHVHFHELWFCLFQFDNAYLEAELFPHWERLCLRHGLRKPDRFRVSDEGENIGLGVNVSGGDQAAEYLVKSSENLAAELAGGGKVGRTGYSYSPWQLMVAASKGKNWARRRYIEYARATHGLGFMDGLKKATDFFHVEGISENDVIRALTKEWITCGLLAREHFFTLRDRGLIPSALKLLESGQSLDSVIKKLCF